MSCEQHVCTLWKFLVSACQTRLDSYKSKSTGTVKKLRILADFQACTGIKYTGIRRHVESRCRKFTWDQVFEAAGVRNSTCPPLHTLDHRSPQYQALVGGGSSGDDDADKGGGDEGGGDSDAGAPDGDAPDGDGNRAADGEAPASSREGDAAREQNATWPPMAAAGAARPAATPRPDTPAAAGAPTRRTRSLAGPSRTRASEASQLDTLPPFPQ
jgi:hypothetical protein